MKKRSIGLVCLMIAALLLPCACAKTAVSGEKTDKTVVTEAEYEAVLRQAQKDGVEVESGLYITRMFAYSGVFPEDSDEREVADAAAVELVNLSPVAYRGLEFTVTCGKAVYRFFVSALPIGGRLTAVEVGGSPLTETDAPAVEVTYADPYAGMLSTLDDRLTVSFTDGTVYVKNIGDQPQKDVCVYYKRTDENGFLGGMTFRVRVGTVTAGETKECAARFLTPGKSKVVFVTAEEGE